jgi:SAM-dependent methyltransferase
VKPWTLAAFASSLLAAATLAAERIPTQPPEFGQASKDSVWVTTPERMIRRMLQIADTSRDDVVMDLGAGDGRIPIYAAKHFGARGIAVELEENLVQVALEAARREGVAERVRVIRQDLFEADLSTATVFALFISPGVMQRLKPRFLELRPGTRITSHQFDLGDWEPDETVEVEGRKGYLWVVPAAVEGTWDLALPGEGFRLRLARRYQKLTASGERSGKSMPVVGARLRGTEIRFTAFDRDGTARNFSGRLEGGRLVGDSHVLGSEGKPVGWSASRGPD